MRQFEIEVIDFMFRIENLKTLKKKNNLQKMRYDLQCGKTYQMINVKMHERSSKKNGIKTRT
jgi:hypothetical protein